MPKKQRLAAAMLLGFCLLGMSAPAAHAAGVEQSCEPQWSAGLGLGAGRLVRHDLAPELAWERVNALSQDVSNALATRHGELPAGGAFAKIVHIGFLVWAVLHTSDYGGALRGDEYKAPATNSPPVADARLCCRFGVPAGSG